MGRTVPQGHIYGSVVRLLCADGKVQDARNLVKKGLTLGIKPSNLVLNAMVTAYCEKRDYDDILSFFVEVRCIPGVHVANKIIHSLCTYLGSQCANSFRLRLEELGFCSNEITLGILIGWSCREGKIKDAFIYFNEILSRRLKPQGYSYDALLSGLFKQGMWKHSQEILYEMKETTDGLQLSTFMVLLAGLCKARQFEEVKAVVFEMADCGFIQTKPLEDPLSKVFTVLGLCPTAVKIRRDSELGYSEAEFYDNLGNGLYLDTDLEKYEAAMTKVLDDAMLPDFKSQILKSIQSKSIKETVITVGNMVNWGQELCLPMFSTLVKDRGYNPDRMSYDLLVCSFCKEKKFSKALLICETMLAKNFTLPLEASVLLIQWLCRNGNIGKAASQVLHRMQQDGYEPDFNTHWALICNLSSSSGKNKSEGFLSRFLSDVGFSRNNPNAKKG
ncbi:unnamed protein product [Cuscuta campestris]|uniref:Pentacotripeptide-repeat region of PRORP domain-containing protein n=1 Tax=Cuscuta campestris TaxID=132261 RepID=A0A484MR45_9ASTE|nr:unnamed protein product [Cuscuta campestris]